MVRPRTPAIARRAHGGCCRHCVTRKRQWAMGGPLRRLRSVLSECARRRLRDTVRVGGDRRASKYDALPLRLHRFIHPCFRGGGGGRRAALSTAVVDGCLEGQVDRRDCEDGSDPCPTAPGTAPGRQAFLAEKLGAGHRDPAGAVEPQTATPRAPKASPAVKSRCELYLSRTPFNQRVSG